MKNLYATLGFGLAAYCLVLLISRDALVETIIILGAGSLGLVSVSLWGLWLRNSQGSEDENPNLL